MKWEGFPVCVTGAHGLIGKPLVRQLERLGANVFQFDLPEHDVMEVGEKSVLRWAVQHTDLVIHLAAVSGVQSARDDPYNAWNLNAMGTLNVLEECRALPTPVVIASSNHVYGRGPRPSREDSPLNHHDTYSATKIAAETMALSYAHTYGLPVSIIRNTNCYGPDDPHEAHLIPATILSVLKGEGPVLHEGEHAKSFLYVDDVANAYVKAAEHLLAAPEGYYSVFNISSEPVSIVDVGVAILDLMDVDYKAFAWVTAPPESTISEELDWSKAKDILGWEPQWTLEEGLKATIAGFKARFEEPARA